MTQQKEKLGLLPLTMLVAGNMIGSGIFLLPSNLAKIGTISLFSWIFTALGAFLLALMFSKMSQLVPKTGGPYAYAKAGLGPFPGFLTAYNYWVSMWIGNSAQALAFVGYLRVFFPALAPPLTTCLVAIGTIWVLAFLNMLGIRQSGLIQVITTFLKLIPLLLIGSVGWFYLHPDYLTHHMNLTHHSHLSAFSAAATLTLWAFIGVESATIPAASVKNPHRNIPLATLLGTLIASITYIASSAAIMGMIPSDVLQHSSSPFADAAQLIFGHWGTTFIALGAAISCMGSLNGWILLSAHVAMAAAEDGLFPSPFALRNKKDVPALGLLLTAGCASVILFLTLTPDLVNQFEQIILLATVAALVPYLITALAALTLLRRKKLLSQQKKHITVVLFSAVYICWAIVGSDDKTLQGVSWLLFSSVPLYFFLKKIGWVKHHTS